MLTFEEGAWTTKAFTRGQNPIAGDSPSIHNNVVGEDYFGVMGLPVVLGRSFGPRDTKDSPKVAVINETMARRFFPGESPLGRRFGLGGPEHSEEIEVVGVVKDAKYERLTETPTPAAYYAYGEGSDLLGNLIVAGEGDPSALVPRIREAVRAAAPALAVDSATTLPELVDRSLTQEKLVARLSAFFGLLALLLASVGLYGLLSYTVARRTNEIGVRMALGARGADVLRLVMREAAGLVLAGAAAGLLAASFGARWVASLLYGLAPEDPTVLVAATLTLAAVAAIAAWLPARRASRVDPLAALRED
jgi:predicted permease